MDTNHENVHLTVADIYIAHRFPVFLIDVLTALPALTTDNMLQGIPVPKKDAELVLAVISAITGQNYNLSNVSVNLEGDTNGGNITPTNLT